MLFCGCKEDKRNITVIGGYTHPDFETNYTEEEHIQRISERTAKKFAEELENGTIISYDVEIVYAFYDNDPEYFLVNLEYAEEQNGSYQTKKEASLDPEKGEFRRFNTKYKHLIGFIEKDIYYWSLMCYYKEFKYGRSCYELWGYEKAKKYYGAGHHGVQTSEGILHIYEPVYGSAEFPLFDARFEYPFEQYIISEKEQEYYMKANYKGSYSRY